MVIGNGQLAKSFKSYKSDHLLIFASGVSNSNCKEKESFDRERILLLENLKKYSDKKFIYFSSCALSAKNYELNDYYQHKRKMEELIKQNSDNYYIFRIPQLFGKLRDHKTLINFLYINILNNTEFKVYDNSYRYVIEIEDTVKLVKSYLKYHESKTTIDLANPNIYKVLDIVQMFEELLNKNAKYKLIKKDDKYLLDLSPIKNFMKSHNTGIVFSENYLLEKLKYMIGETQKKEN